MNMSTKQAIMHLETGDIETARRLIIAELENALLDPECWLAMGLVQAESRDYDYAAQSLEKYLHCLKAKHDAV